MHAPLPLDWSPPPDRWEELIHRLKQVTPRVMDNPHAEPDVPEWRRRSVRKAAVALIFVQEDSPKLILTKRSDALPFAGQWCFPGGKEKAEDDLNYENILIDKTSADLLKGSEVDYVSELIGEQFKITNPQTKSSCGCGVSFSL